MKHELEERKEVYYSAKRITYGHLKHLDVEARFTVTSDDHGTKSVHVEVTEDLYGKAEHQNVSFRNTEHMRQWAQILLQFASFYDEEDE